MNIVDMAHQILDMAEENETLRRENAMLRAFQQEALKDTIEGIRNGEKQMVGWIELLMSDRVKLLPETTP